MAKRQTRTMQPLTGFSLTQNKTEVDVDFVKGSRKVAPYVHPVIGGKTVPNEGYETRSYKPPLVAPDTITTIDDLLNRQPGKALYQAGHLRNVRC